MVADRFLFAARLLTEGETPEKAADQAGLTYEKIMELLDEELPLPPIRSLRAIVK